MHTQSARGLVSMLASALLGAACGDSQRSGGEATAGDGSVENGQFDGGDGGGQDGDGGDLGDGPTSNTPGTDGGGPQSSAEVCDGVDNDQNGIIDDVDADGDGVCDCLNIATIGEIGPWSNGGNVFRTWLDSRTPLGADELGDQVLTDELLQRYQVIVVLYAATMELDGNGRTLAAHHAFSAEEVAAFERWVRNGGGVMTTAGYHGNEAAEVVNVNTLLAPLGAGYSTSKLEVQGEITSWETHPLADEVLRIRVRNGVEPDGSSATSIAFDPGNRVALQVTEADQGRVAVWSDEWITYDSEWAESADQQVSRFWLNILKWLRPARVCQVPIPTLL